MSPLRLAVEPARLIFPGVPHTEQASRAGGGQELVHRCLPVLWNFCEDARSCPPKASRTFEGDPPPESPGGPACVQVLGEGAQWGGMGLWRGKRRLM